MSCESTASTPSTNTPTDVTNKGTFGEAVVLPVKDFVTLGLIFTEHSYRSNVRDANVFTYQALLKEAQKLGADAIINVAIDRRRQAMGQGSTYVILETWYGSALAIKYTNVVQPNVPVSDPHQSPAEGTPARNPGWGVFGQR
jgi:uncharacterized protein YbjQ (UPF0145 family)